MHIDRLERIYLVLASLVMGAFFAALVAGALIFDVRLPGPSGRLNPEHLNLTEFAEPGLRDMGDNTYNVYMTAQMWAFNPAEIQVPVGAEVTFFVTSKDITHGFIIERHNLNFELLPGHIARGTIHFNEEGEYHLLCHEYCGPGHHNMVAKIAVGDAPAEDAAEDDTAPEAGEEATEEPVANEE